MNVKHALFISLAVGVAAVAGILAATKTIHLGRQAAVKPAPPSALIAKRTMALDRTEIALRKALKQKPPKLPPLPASAAASPTGTPPVSSQPRVVYVRPAPIIRHVPRPGGHEGDDGEHQAAQGSQHDGEGGGFDD